MVSSTQYGELSERFKELVLKTSDSERNLGFESLTLRHKKALIVIQSEPFSDIFAFGERNYLVATGANKS